MMRAPICGLLALCAAQSSAAPLAGPTPTLTPGRPSAAHTASPGPTQSRLKADSFAPGILALAAAVDASRLRVDAELGALDGGPLSKALLRAAHAGRRLRILLDPERPDSRAIGGSLADLSPSTEVRWCRSGEIDRRWMDLDGLKQLAWYSGENPKALSASAAATAERFEDDWSAGRTRLPEALRLNDQLQSLPDPREKTPHYTPRQPPSGEP